MSQTETVKMFRATEPLMVGRFRAHNTGDLIPEAAVKRGGWEKQVVDAEKEVQVADPNATPARSASHTDWVGYASDQARGDQRLSIEEASSLKRHELVEMYLGKG